MPTGKFSCIPTIDEHVQLCKDEESLYVIGLGDNPDDDVLFVRDNFKDVKLAFTTDEFMKDFNDDMRKKGKEDKTLIRVYSKDPENETFTQRVDVAINRSRLDEILLFIPEPVEKIELDKGNFGNLEL